MTCTTTKKAIPLLLLSNFDRLSIRRIILRCYGSPSNAYQMVNGNGEDVLMSVNRDTGILIRTFKKDGTVVLDAYDKDGISQGRANGGTWK